ncbi:glycosyltransferase [Celeribacter halophilus]|uniref:glycosyltransferase n=1 Tax=Celeribacter halophilus TaxID=576117 RepID=UPI002FD150A7
MIKNIRVLIVSQSYPPDPIRGAEKVAMSVAKALCERCEVQVLALGDQDGYDDSLGYRVHRIVYHNKPRPGVQNLDLGVVQKVFWHGRNALGGVNPQALRVLLKEIAPDVVYIHNASGLQPQLFQACQAFGFPVVQHLHDYATLCPSTTMYKNGSNYERPPITSRILTSAFRRAAKQVGDVIAVSNFVKKRHATLGVYPKARWHVVYNTDPTNLEEYVPKSEGIFTFGFIGALTEAKGLGDLVSAYESLPAGSARLVIAGQGEEDYVAALRARCADLTVDWMGQTSPNDFYSSIDCLVVPSRWHEPQALVVVEGLRRGLPIIASDRGGNTEVLQNRPGHRLYDPDATGALADAMVAMTGVNKPAPVSLNDDFFARIEAILLAAVKNGVGHA